MASKLTGYYTERFRARKKAKEQGERRAQELELQERRACEDYERSKLMPKFNEALARAMACFDSRDWDGAREISKPGGRRRDRTIPAMYLYEGICLATDGELYRIDDPMYEYPTEHLDPKTLPPYILKDVTYVLNRRR